MGFRPRVGVLIDAFVVRLALSRRRCRSWAEGVVAATVDGQAMPNVDIEGESLRTGEPPTGDFAEAVERVH